VASVHDGAQDERVLARVGGAEFCDPLGRVGVGHLGIVPGGVREHVAFYPLPLMGLAETCEAVGDAAAAKAYLQEAVQQLDVLTQLPTRSGVPAGADIARAKFGLARVLYPLNARDARVPVLVAQARAIYLECHLPPWRRDSVARIDAWLDATAFHARCPESGGQAGGEDPQGGLR